VRARLTKPPAAKAARSKAAVAFEREIERSISSAAHRRSLAAAAPSCSSSRSGGARGPAAITFDASISVVLSRVAPG
jgi:hypothetical protein